jgi:hypothetical protein
MKDRSALSAAYEIDGGVQTSCDLDLLELIQLASDGFLPVGDFRRLPGLLPWRRCFAYAFVDYPIPRYAVCHAFSGRHLGPWFRHLFS